MGMTFNSFQLVECFDDSEWGSAKTFRNKYFFQPHKLKDPYTWTFDHKDHKHFVLYKNSEIVGYAHIQLWPGEKAAMRIIVIDECKRGKGYGKKFVTLIEKWLRGKGYKSIHIERSKKALGFYKSLDYVLMPFKDPDGYESSPEDTAIGKFL